MTLLVVSAGCIENPFAEPPPKKKALLELIEDSQTVARGDNTTFILLVKNKDDQNHSMSVKFGPWPDGWSGHAMNETVDVNANGERGVLLRVFISENAPLGKKRLKVTTKFLDKTKYTDSIKIKITVVAPTQGDGRCGDTMRVDYIGYLEDGLIFDTSITDVGRNLNIPRWSGFSAGTYRPLEFKLCEGEVVKGFDDGSAPLTVGQSRTVFVPRVLGYADFENATIDLTDRIPMRQELSWNDFTLKYEGEPPVVDKVVKDPYWEWSVRVLDVQNQNVTIMIQPQALMNKTIHPYGWNSKITKIDSSANGNKGLIVVEHKPSYEVNTTYEGSTGEITELTDKTVTISYNKSPNPLSEYGLWFQVKLIEVIR
jgi:FKBP-type peptidyl-prolyl cis-trans isomerase 2